MTSFIELGTYGNKYCGGPKPDVFARITPDVLSWIYLMIERKVPSGTGNKPFIMHVPYKVTFWGQKLDSFTSLWSSMYYFYYDFVTKPNV